MDSLIQKLKPDKNGQDGGWGWVIVAVCFCCQLVIEGIIGTYGLLFPELASYFSVSPALVALPGSLILGTFLLMGAFCSGLIHIFGCRKVSFVGTLLAAIGFVLGYCSFDIYTFLLSYGVISGIGIGMLYLPSQLMVNSYFTRKRGIAQGIVCSGSGVGMMAIAPFVEYFLNLYGWRGTVLMCGGLFAQLCVLVLLMRPPTSCGVPSPDTISTDSEDDTLINQQKDIPKIIVNDTEKAESINVVEKDFQLNPKSNKSQQKPNVGLFESTYSLPVNMNRSEEKNFPQIFLSMQNIDETSPQVFRQRKVESQESIFCREDILFSASTSFLKKYESCSSMRNADHQIDQNTIDEQIRANDEKYEHYQCLFRCKAFLAKMCQPTVLKNKAFILLSLGCILTQMAQYIPMVFLADYGIKIGLQRQRISMLFIGFGILNTIGRLFAGVLVNSCQFMKPLWVCNIGAAVCAGACFLFPFCSSFETLAVFMTIFGFFIGFTAPSQPLVTLEYVGLENLTSAFGMITVMKGPAAIAGPPMAGGLYELTGDHRYSTVVAGGLFLLTCVFQSFIPCASKPYLDRMNKNQEVKINT